MKNKLLTSAGVLALAAILGTYFAKPLLAQVRAALVKNLDEPARVPYQAPILCGGGFTPCSATGGFFVALPPVPAHSRLVVEQVSLLIQTNGTLNLASLATASPIPLSESQGPLWIIPPFTFLPVTQSPAGYAVNQSVKYYFEAGATPAINLVDITSPQTGAALGVSMQGMVSGYIVDLSQ